MGSEISGYFISFTREESELVEKELAAREYEVNPVGLKEYLIDSFDDEGTDSSLAEQISDFIKKNPDVLNVYASVGSRAIQGIIEKVSGAIKKARTTAGPDCGPR